MTLRGKIIDRKVMLYYISSANDTCLCKLLCQMEEKMSENTMIVQEHCTKKEVIITDTIPIDFIEGNKELLERQGVKFMGPVPGDDLFQYVELPHGWTTVATSNQYWTDLLNHDGKVVARIMYKETFYDKKAHIRAYHHI